MDTDMPFDAIFDSVGHFGVYQIIMFFAFGLFAFTGNETISLNFYSYTPDHWCNVDELKEFNDTIQNQVAIPDGQECHMYKLNYSQYDHKDFLNWNRSEYVNATTVGCTDGWQYDTSMIRSSIATKWDLVCSDAWLVPLVGSISIVGFLLASVIVGPTSDRFGRRPTLIAFLILKVGGNFLSAFAPNYATVLVARLFLALGSLCTYVIAFSTILELVGPAYRSFAGLGYAILNSCGFVAAVLYAYLLRDDQSLQIVISAIPSCLLLIIWFMPESPRWLILNGRLDEADKVLRSIAWFNRRTLPDDFNVKHFSVTKESSYNANIIDIVKSPVLRKRGSILCLHWFTDSLIFYALSLNVAALSGDLYMNTFIAGAVEIPANGLAIVWMNWKRIGRRGTAVLSLVIAGVASLICIPLILTEASPTSVTALAMVGKAGATMGFNCIYVYTAEVFPTEVRNLGLGICSFSARISGILAPYVGGLLGNVWLPFPSLIFGSFGVIAGLTSLLLPETLNANLPDTIKDVEREAKKNYKSNGNVDDGESLKQIQMKKVSSEA